MQIRWQGLPTRDKPWSPTNNDDSQYVFFITVTITVGDTDKSKTLHVAESALFISSGKPNNFLYRGILISF